MATMNMRRAFNSKMLTKMTLYEVQPGYYNEYNDWVDGSTKTSTLWGVVVTGNKFSQFDEGIAVHNMDGGTRLSDYRSLHITNKFRVSIGDKILYKGKYFNITQEGDEDDYGFKDFLLEKTEAWTP